MMKPNDKSGNVKYIPATKRVEQAGGQFKTAKNIKVAAYARVSTLEDNQQTSYATQCSYYENYINSNPDWTFAGMYADEGISGTSRKHRKQFNAMMEAAEKGEIDFIVTKSISRFARNTVDTLSCVRKLKELNPPVGVYFEKENIDSLDAKGELVLTILSAIAQEESRSISTNIRWSIERLFKNGIPIVNLSRMLGYYKGSNGEWLIDEEQAKTVRYIFESYVCGRSASKIARELNAIGRLTVTNGNWTSGSVLGILRNEKYVGDVEMQKTITISYLSHKAVKNTGQAPRYYYHDHHVGIIDRFTWDKAQARLGGLHNREPKGKTETAKRNNKSALHNITCGVCGAKFNRVAYTMNLVNYTDGRSLEAEGVPDGLFSEKYYFNYPIWRCSEKFKFRGKSGRLSDEEWEASEERCTSKILHEVAIKQSFMEMLYKLKREYEENGDDSRFVKDFKATLKKVYEDSLTKSGEGDLTAQRLALLNQEIETFKAQKEEALENKVTAISEETAAMYDAMEMGLDYEPPVESAADLYSKLADDIQHKIEALYREKQSIEGDQETTVTMKENFDFFIDCLLSLPEKNKAGMKLNVNGRDVEGTVFTDADGKADGQARGKFNRGVLHLNSERMEKAPDMLDFDEGIYMAFFPKAVAEGNTLRLISNFGVEFRVDGIERNLRSFLGYRRIADDGRTECITESWQVYNAAVCYKRRAYRKRKSDHKDNLLVKEDATVIRELVEGCKSKEEAREIDPPDVQRFMEEAETHESSIQHKLDQKDEIISISEPDNPSTQRISFPIEGHTGLSLRNLVYLIHSRAELINKATGAHFKVDSGLIDALKDDACTFSTLNFRKAVEAYEDQHGQSIDGLVITPEGIIFTGFTAGMDADRYKACADLASAMNKMAIEQKRVQPTAKPVENEKYAFRIWLVRMGMGGDEYKRTRKLLMKNLSGHSAFRTPEDVKRAGNKAKSLCEEQKENEATSTVESD